MRVLPLRFWVLGFSGCASSSDKRCEPLAEGFVQEKVEKRERTGCETCLVNRGRMIGRQTLAKKIIVILILSRVWGLRIWERNLTDANITFDDSPHSGGNNCICKEWVS